MHFWIIITVHGSYNSYGQVAFFFFGNRYGQVVTPRIFSLVCFRLLPPQNNQDGGNKLNRELLDIVNSTGKIFISHTVSSLFFPRYLYFCSVLSLISSILLPNEISLSFITFFYTGSIRYIHIAICSRGAIDWREACECSLESFARWGLYLAGEVLE